MKTDSIPGTLDDIIFENRNHEYGAYAIRRSYSDHVNKGAMLAMSAVAVVVILSFVPREMVPKEVRGKSGEGILMNDQPHIIPTRPPSQPQQQQVQRSRDLPPRAVTTEPADLPVEPIDDVVSGPAVIGTDVGGSVDFIDGGTDITDVPAIVEPPAVLDRAEVMPEYIGGLQGMMHFIVGNTRYPARARRVEKEGTVFVSFIVGKNGAVLEPRLVKGFDPDCDQEALRVVSKMPFWKPGSQGGKPVMVRMVIPIRFKLST